MSDSVKKIMDRLFGEEETEESIRALREEIENNCEEHYDDLIRQGYGEQEAAEEIARSLQGMEEVVAEMRREAAAAKPARVETPEIQVRETEKPVEKPAVEADPFEKGEKDGEPVSRDGHLVISASGLGLLKAQASSEDLVFRSSADGWIHIIWDPENGRKVNVYRTGSVLHLNVTVESDEETAKKAAPERNPFKDEHGNFTLNLQDLLSFVRKTVTTGIMKVVPAQIRVEIPELLFPTLDAATRSGEIQIHGLTLQEATLRSGSGDIGLAEGRVQGVLNCATTSGDIRVSVPTGKSVLSSISGDLSYTGDTREIRLQSTSGDIDLNAAFETGEATTVSGDIDAEVRDVRSLAMRSTSGDVDLDWDNGAPAAFETSTLSGDVYNEIGNDPSAAVHVRIKTISGDIPIR